MVYEDSSRNKWPEKRTRILPDEILKPQSFCHLSLIKLQSWSDSILPIAAETGEDNLQIEIS